VLSRSSQGYRFVGDLDATIDEQLQRLQPLPIAFTDVFWQEIDYPPESSLNRLLRPVGIPHPIPLVCAQDMKWLLLVRFTLIFGLNSPPQVVV